MGVDLIDFTALQKRGLLKNYVEEKEVDLIDFSKSVSSQTTQTNNNPLSFFDSVSSPTTPAASFFDVPSSNSSTPVLNAVEDNSFKIKLDDFEYKMEKLLERLDKIESKISDFERNMRV